MKKYLVKLNHPVIILVYEDEKKEYQSIYGFIAPFCDDEEERKTIIEDNLGSYVGYLAAMHEWSTTGTDEFSLGDGYEWIDPDNNVHDTIDQWTIEFVNRSRERVGLDYTLYIIEIGENEVFCPGFGMRKSFITCGSLMTRLINLAEQQALGGKRRG